MGDRMITASLTSEGHLTTLLQKEFHSKWILERVENGGAVFRQFDEVGLESHRLF